MNYTKVSKLAYKTVDYFQVSDSPPISLIKIVKSEGIKLYAKDLPDGISGAMIFDSDKKPTIVVNSKHTKNRQRFTIAHELGHFFITKEFKEDIISDKDISFRFNGFYTKSQEEEERMANFFAASLLMPEKMVKEYWKFSEGSVSTMAELFMVSVEAMNFRLKHLKLK